MDIKQKTYSIFEKFKNVPNIYRPAVMWFWNDEIKEEEITFQLEKFKEQGIYDIFVNAVWGTTIEYLSPRFFELVKYTVKEAKHMGMRYWIYDEFNWPSGIAGGYLLRDEPWTRGIIMKCETLAMLPGFTSSVRFDGKFIAAQVIYDGITPNPVDITHEISIIKDEYGFKAEFTNRSCSNCTLYIFFTDLQRSILAAAMWGKYSWNQEGYLDVFNPGAVRRFIEYTHEKYKEAVGDEFGKTVIGVFTDEVCVSSPFDLGKGKIPWSENFREEFEKMNGYDILPLLYALYTEPRNEKETKARYDYWRTVTSLFRENYIKQAYQWCSENNLLYTGHFDGEESMLWHTFQSGDIFEVLPYMHIPGIDSIFSKEKINDQNFNIAGKILSSSARFNKHARTLCETYTGSGWELRLEDMRKIANRLLVLGVNMIQYMGAYYSLDGARKQLPMGYPPSHSYNNTLYEHYGLLGDYIARLSYLSGITMPCGKVLVILPLTTVYKHIEPGDDLFEYRTDRCSVRKYDRVVEGTVNALLELNIEFDIGYEGLAGEMECINGKVLVRDIEYNCLILPSMEYTNEKMYTFINSYIDSGGQLIFVNGLIEKTADTGRRTGFYEKLGFDGARDIVSKSLNDTTAPFCERYFSKYSNASLIVTNMLDSGKNQQYKDALLELLGEEAVTLKLKHEGGVYSCHRRNENMDVYFISNHKPENVCVSGEIPLPGNVLFLDPDTGSRWDVDLRHGEDGSRTFNLKLAAYEIMAIVCIHPSAACDDCVSFLPVMKRLDLEKAGDEVIELREGWYFKTAEGNYYVLDFILLKSNAAKKFVNDDLSDKELERFLINPGAGDGVYCRKWEIPGGYGVNFGDPYVVTSEFYIDNIPQNRTYLIMETGDVKAVYLNGVKLNNIKPYRIWGINNGRVDITNFIREGINVLVVKASVPSWHMPHNVPFMALQGDFCLDETRNIISPVDKIEAGSWTTQGYVNYSGKAIYMNTFNIEKSFNSVIIKIETRDAVSVYINKMLAAKRLWPPYELDITEFCNQGNNSIALEFTSTYANIHSSPVESGLLSPPKVIIR